MSGGSFNYLCYKDAGELVSSSRQDLNEMVSALDALGSDAKEIADRTRAIPDRIAEIQAEIDALSDVWKAVEWWQSCDWSRERVFVEIGRYKERHK